MAQRRMFSPQIIDSDAFLDMPPSTQSLYFHLGMRADDDGFVGNPKKIMKIIGSSDDDIRILLAKRFLLTFESGVIVIKHWRINNLVRKDWYKETIYIEEKNQLKVKENGAYTELVNENSPTRSRRLGKVSIGKVVTPSSNDDSGANAQPTTYGNKDINTIISHLEQVMGFPLDGSVQNSRRAAHTALSRAKKAWPERDPVTVITLAIDRGATDEFHRRNMTTMVYVSNNLKKLLLTNTK